MQKFLWKQSPYKIRIQIEKGKIHLTFQEDAI